MVFVLSKKLLAKKGTFRIALKKDPQDLVGANIEVKQLDCHYASKQETSAVVDTEKKSTYDI